MAEKLTPRQHHEHEPTLPNHEAAHHKEKLGKHLEKKAEHAERSRETVETARHRVEQEAVTGKETRGKKAEKHTEDEYISKQDKAHTFTVTMNRVQSRLNPPSRAFSKVIHRPTVDRVSDAASKTIARPSAIMGAGLAVFIGLGYVLLVARRVGFALSGSEFIILLAFGWVLGLVAEFLVKGLKRSLSR